MDELLRDFLTETSEHIQGAENQLVLFERNPNDASLIASIFRLVHTVKGTSSFLGLNRLQRVAHAAETLLGQMRDGAPPTERSVSLVLTAIDRIRSIVDEVDQVGAEPDGDDSDVTAAVEAHAHDLPPTVNVFESVAASIAAEADVEAASDADFDSQEQDHASAPVEATVDHKSSVQVPSEPKKADSTQKGGGQRSQETIRVAVDTIERMMQLVSELVLTRNQLLELARHRDDEEVKAPLQRLSALTTDLQDAVMRARMQPVARLFSNLPRLVRELSSELGKKIDLVTEGADTELDRQLIEVIRDPLTHLIRNCADHGIETPQTRVAAGKREFGEIRVAASHEAGQITIEVADDGKGLDLERIKKKAVSQGLVTEQDLARLSEEEIYRFVFEPGFSTAQQLTSVSGRGVGMDVVRSNIESIGGSISLFSSPGRGSRFSMKIPLTLAIAPALIIEVSKHRFALPQHAVVEAVSIGRDSRHLIETVQKALVLKLREEVLPVVDLRDVLGLENTVQDDAADRLVVIVRDGASSFGVIVDSVSDIQEIVVKPLSASLAHIKVFTGHTILGDGSVALILDPAGLSARLGIEKTAEKRRDNSRDVFKGDEQRTRVALFRAGEGTAKMLPLSLVSRIEMVEADKIQRSGQDYVMNYQGKLMLLFPLSPGVEFSRPVLPVLVINVDGAVFGLLVEEVVDIIEERLNVQITGADPCVVGLTEVRGKAAELIDISHYLQGALAMVRSERSTDRRILIVENNLHDRETLGPVLAANGYKTICAATAQHAFELLEQGLKVHALVLGMDIGGGNRAELADRIRRKLAQPELPVIALMARGAGTRTAAVPGGGSMLMIPKSNRSQILDALVDSFEAMSDATANMEMAA